jgi:hypothetical protein
MVLGDQEQLFVFSNITVSTFAAYQDTFYELVIEWSTFGFQILLLI